MEDGESYVTTLSVSCSWVFRGQVRSTRRAFGRSCQQTRAVPGEPEPGAHL